MDFFENEPFDDDLEVYEEEQVFQDREFDYDDSPTVQNLGSYNEHDGLYPCDRCGKDTPGNGAYPLIFCPECRPKCGVLLPD